MGEGEVRQYLHQLVDECEASVRTQRMVLAAIKFLCTVALLRHVINVNYFRRAAMTDIP